MDINGLLMNGRFFINFLYDNIKVFFSFIYRCLQNLVNTLILYKKIVFILLAVIILLIILKFLWRNRESLSKFLWMPEPLVSGLMLNLFGRFYKNHLTEGLLELQSFISTLPTTTPIIVILGDNDYFDNIVTCYKSSHITWLFIRNNIYIYIKYQDDVKFIISFLNKIRNKQPINSVVIKTDLKDGVPGDVIKTIAMTSGIKTPLYLSFHNIKWCEYMWEIFDKNSILGFLLDKNDAISSLTLTNDLNNLKLYIWEIMLKKSNCQLDFWNDFDEIKDQIIEVILYVLNLNYNFFRGVFFTADETRVHLNHLLEVPEEKVNYFIGFYENVVEKEVLLAIPLNEENTLINRYTKYQNTAFIVALVLIISYFINMNLNMFMFSKKYNNYLSDTNSVLSQQELAKNSNKSQIYTVYPIMSKMNDINLNNINYNIFPHVYLVNNIYEKLCQIEETLVFHILDTNNDQIENAQQKDITELTDTAFKQYYDYTNKILELEANILNSEKIKRFGIYKKRNEHNNQNAKMFFEKAFQDVRDKYCLFFKNFLSVYCSDDLLTQVTILQDKIDSFMKKNDIIEDHLKNLIQQYYQFNNALKMKNNKLQMASLLLLFARLEKSFIFGPSTVIETTTLLKNALATYYTKLLEVRSSIVGSILALHNENLVICDKLQTLIQDIERFLREPFMEKVNSNGPQIPNGNMISAWNIPVLKDMLNLRNKIPEYKTDLESYSPELQPIFFSIFQQQISKSLYNKVGIAQNIISLSSANIQNISDGFNIIETLLSFLLETGNLDYYEQIIAIFLHDLSLIHEKVEDQLKQTIFYSYARIIDLKKDNVQEFLCGSTKQNKIKDFLNDETDRLIRIFNNLVSPVLKILESDHFTKYRATQYQKYRSLEIELKKYDKGLENSIQRFTQFIIGLQNYTIYNSFRNPFGTYDNDDDDGYINNLLNNLKSEIIRMSQKLYTEEIVLSYDTIKQEFKAFMSKFPINSIYDYHNCISIAEFYNFLQKNKNVINSFENNSLMGSGAKESMYKLKSLLTGVKKDGNSYFYIGKIIYNSPDVYSKNNKYVGLVNINQTKDYLHYLIQDEIKLNIENPIYMHIEISHTSDMKILSGNGTCFKVEKTSKGIMLIFNDFFAFLEYIRLHEESKNKEDITIMVSIPVVFGKIHTNIKFTITFKNFLFFPNHLNNINDTV